jgi:hypothetical protein
LASQPKKYGVIGAGAVSRSLIGQLPGKARDLGPVSAVSYRVASRVANTLRAGYPVRTAKELNDASTILFHAPADQFNCVLTLLDEAEIQWAGRALVFCDCEVPAGAVRCFQAKGASTASVRHFGIPGLLAVDGSGAALTTVHRIARAAKMKALQIAAGSSDAFDAAITFGNAAMTPLIDCAAVLLRDAGIRDIEATRVAAALFEQTARDYARSGKQSWAWHMRKPELSRMEAQIAAAGPRLGPLLRRLLWFGLASFDKHAEVAAMLGETDTESVNFSSESPR